jgi:hypothetical protein
MPDLRAAGFWMENLHMKSALILPLLLTAFQFAHAQLGESDEKCATLFGKPLRTTGPDVSGTTISTYRTATFQVTAAFKQGTAAYFIYHRNDGAGMSDAEIQSILDTHPPERGHWSKKVITGERRAAVHSVSRLKSPFHDVQHGPREWHVLGHDEICAAYFFEKNILLIWNSKTGFDAASILKQNRL